ncbi:MAG: DUF5710 domain-containing protein, partial [Dysgonomonas sp.]
MRNNIYLDVPYSQKDEAKALGAKWDNKIKKWYYDGEVKNFSKFGKWLINKHDELSIIYEDFCIIEGKQVCYKCKKETRVIGFGIRKHSTIYWDDEY